MHRKSLLVTSVVMLVVLCLGSGAFARVQAGRVRDFYWGFDTQSWTIPATSAGPAWDSQGWECDEIYVIGNCSPFWFETSALWTGREGLLGYFNNSNDTIEFSLVFHVNNYPEPNDYKCWMADAEFKLVNKPLYDDIFSIVVPENFISIWSKKAWPNLDGSICGMAEGQILPNPAWEEFIWKFRLGPGQGLLIDWFRVSTVCVPEPGSVATFVTGGIGILSYWRRKRNRRR